MNISFFGEYVSMGVTENVLHYILLRVHNLHSQCILFFKNYFRTFVDTYDNVPTLIVDVVDMECKIHILNVFFLFTGLS